MRRTDNISTISVSWTVCDWGGLLSWQHRGLCDHLGHDHMPVLVASIHVQAVVSTPNRVPFHPSRCGLIRHDTYQHCRIWVRQGRNLAEQSYTRSLLVRFRTGDHPQHYHLLHTLVNSVNVHDRTNDANLDLPGLSSLDYWPSCSGVGTEAKTSA